MSSRCISRLQKGCLVVKTVFPNLARILLTLGWHQSRKLLAFKKPPSIGPGYIINSIKACQFWALPSASPTPKVLIENRSPANDEDKMSCQPGLIGQQNQNRDFWKEGCNPFSTLECICSDIYTCFMSYLECISLNCLFAIFFWWHFLILPCLITGFLNVLSKNV